MKKLFLISSVVCLLVVSGCGQIKKDNSTLPTHADQAVTSTSNTTTQENITTSTIDKNDVSTWPRFEFKELGFSVQLPFEKKLMSEGYIECRKGVAFDENKKPINYFCIPEAEFYYKKTASIMTDTLPWSGVHIGSVSEKFAAERDLLVTDIHDFELYNKEVHKNPGRYMSNEWVWVIRYPLEKFFQQGNLIVINDLYKDYYEQADQNFGQDNRRTVFGIYLKLSRNKKFKAAVIELEKTADIDWSLARAKMVAKSIKFNR
jgi:hypothetical protein